MDVCVRVFINYRPVPVMLGKVTLHALCDRHRHYSSVPCRCLELMSYL